MNYTPQDHAAQLLRKLLGCERWEPSAPLLEKIRQNPPENFRNRREIRNKLRDLEERTAYGHETKIGLILSGETAEMPTPSDLEDFKRNFGVWWDSLRTSDVRKNQNITTFVEEWAQGKGLLS